jgi:uncharacterized protein (DUF1810 family)
MIRSSDASSRDDPFDLERFVAAQRPLYATALTELRSGDKRTHWMWFVFPQVIGLGASSTARHYAIRSREEARRYLDHPVLGPRLRECAEAILAVEGRTASDIFGYPDDLKLKSSMTLFAGVEGPGSVFERVLAKYCGGRRCERTLELLRRG